MKKRTKKLAAMGMAAVMAAALLSGCGKTKATPENLLRDMTEKAEKAESAVANLKFNISLSSGGAELAVNMDMDMEVTAEPEASYGKGEISVDIAGSGMSTEMEMYSVKEDDQYVTYTMMDGQWTKEISDEEEALGDIEGMTGDIEDYADKFELEKELAEINGEECFELCPPRCWTLAHKHSVPKTIKKVVMLKLLDFFDLLLDAFFLLQFFDFVDLFVIRLVDPTVSIPNQNAPLSLKLLAQ